MMKSRTFENSKVELEDPNEFIEVKVERIVV